MQNFTLTIVTPVGDIQNITFDPTNTAQQLYGSISSKLNLSRNSFVLVFNGKPMSNKFNNLIQYGIKNGDVIQVQHNQPQQASQNLMQNAFGAPQPQANQTRLLQEATALRDKYLNNTSELNMLLQRDPEMAEAILSDNIQVTVEFIVKRKNAQQQAKLRKMQEEQKLMQNPFDIQAQMEIEKRIKEERMNKELEYAHENMPESFIQTTMLYIPMEVNGKEFHAFVDSGAQSTIMSKAFADRCGLLKDVDTRYQGTAVGVGTTKIIGRIHRCGLKVNGHTIECSIQVLDQGQSLQMLFGLDMLKKHRCCINLLDNCLEFKTEGFSVGFLKDHEIREGHIKSKIFKMQIKPATLLEKEGRIKSVMRRGATRSQAIALLEKYHWDKYMARNKFMKMSKILPKGSAIKTSKK